MLETIIGLLVIFKMTLLANGGTSFLNRQIVRIFPLALQISTSRRRCHTKSKRFSVVTVCATDRIESKISNVEFIVHHCLFAVFFNQSRTIGTMAKNAFPESVKRAAH